MTLNLASIHEAIAEVVPDRECLIFRDRRYSWAEDRDLSKQAPSDPLSQAAPATLESVMEGAASHLAEHADELKAVAG